MSGGTVDNVLFVSVDSLRYDTWQSLQPSLTAGPTLESEGTSFSRAFATGPGTVSSFPGMLTGTLPLSHGGIGPLRESRPRVASELQRQGYATAGFHSNPFLSENFNYDVGFDRFHDYQNPLMGVATRIFPRGIEINTPIIERIDEVIGLTDLIKSTYRRVQGKPRPYVSAEVITDDAIEWLKDTQDPFFGWVHYMDVHHPCHPPSSDRAAFGVEEVDSQTVSELYSTMIGNPESLTDSDEDILQKLYRAAIRYVDRQILRLIETLREQGQFENTLIVLTSDHGELFGDYGQYGKPDRMFDELIRIPLLIVNSPPSAIGPEDDLISLLDLPPLLHTALGETVPQAYEGKVPGQQSRKFIQAENEVDGDLIIGVRSENWWYEIDQIRSDRRLLQVPSHQEVELTNGNLDSEAEMVIDAANARLEELDGTVDSATDPRLDDGVKKRLEDLGYR